MNKTSRDRNLVSDEPWEVEYIHKQFPNTTHAEVEAALEDCKRELNGSEDRDKIMQCMRSKLS